MAKIYHWGIIGPGKIARKFAADLQQLPQARLWAVASRDAGRAEVFAAAYDIPHAYDDPARLLECPGLDVVYIATPHAAHYPLALLCLQRGMPVLCEKPLALNAMQVQHLTALAAQRCTFLMEALWTRFMPHIRKAVELVEEGAIGDLLTIDADFCTAFPFDPDSRAYNRELGGGALLDIGIYPVFLAQLFFGVPVGVKAVAALGRTKVDESCMAILSFPGRRLAQVHCSFRHHSPTGAWLYGTKGNLEILPRFHGLSGGLVLHRQGEAPVTYPFTWDCWGYRYEAAHVMECLDQGLAESPEMPHQFSLELIQTLDAIRREADIVYPEADGVVSFRLDPG